MGHAVAYFLVVAVALVAGVWSTLSFHRRNPNYRTAASFRNPFTALLKGLLIAVPAAAAGLGLAWLLGEWSGLYLTALGVFLAANFVGLIVWSVVRNRTDLERV